ncbi:MAG: hypothetical protein ACD_50C00190G0006 [uncultured bacterium]|nr:MAG: hypothetical protein ACD_50C00190G0006 [uncultured bacterium]OGH14108.1 MAG: hypothetical protein A2687_02475 [Candidatus Levybacteria bacterium RIFCSPHIGHO2_01_FULL_38_26]
MQFFILVVFACFFIFLFPVYLLSRDDFVLIRKDVTTENVFNIAFVLLAASLFAARVLYAVSNPSFSFLNPFVFFLFPYFPGLSLVGGVGGAALFLLMLSRFKKLPTGRLFDIFSISALCSLPFGILGYFGFSGDVFSQRSVALFMIHVIELGFFLKFLLPKMTSARFKDGTLGFLFLIFFSVTFLADNILVREGDKLRLGIEDLVLILILYTSAVFLFRQEKLLAKVRKNLRAVDKLRR